MPEIEVTAGGPNYDIEEGIYPAIIFKTENDEMKNAKFKSGHDILRIWIRLDDMVTPDEEPVEIDAIASRKLSPSTKLWGWAENLGFKLDPTTSNRWNSDALHGMPCRVVIGSKKKTDGSVWPTVENILAPLKGSGLRAVPPAPTAAAAQAEAPAESAVADRLQEKAPPWFWNQVKELGITPEQVESRLVRPLGKYDDAQLEDLIELLKLDYLSPA